MFHPATPPRSSTSSFDTSAFSAASSGDLQSLDFSASTPSITSGSASDPSSESASHSASADSFNYSSGASAVAGSYESSEADSDVPSNIADGQLTPPEETPHAAAHRIVDGYFFASHSGIAFRGADPSDTAEGETLEEFLAWCIRGARRHEIAIMRDLIADHGHKLDVMYEWKARRRDLCEDIGTLRQRYAEFVRARDQFLIETYRLKLEACVRHLNDVSDSTELEGLDEGIEMHEEVCRLLLARVALLEKDMWALNPPRL